MNWKVYHLSAAKEIFCGGNTATEMVPANRLAHLSRYPGIEWVAIEEPLSDDSGMLPIYTLPGAFGSLPKLGKNPDFRKIRRRVEDHLRKGDGCDIFAVATLLGCFPEKERMSVRDAVFSD